MHRTVHRKYLNAPLMIILLTCEHYVLTRTKYQLGDEYVSSIHTQYYNTPMMYPNNTHMYTHVNACHVYKIKKDYVA